MKKNLVRKGFFLTPKQAKHITKEALKYKRTESDIVRIILDEYLLEDSEYNKTLFKKK